MSHVAVYKVSLGKIKPEIFKNSNFTKTLIEAFKEVFHTDEIQDLGHNRFRVIVKEGAFMINISNGQLNIGIPDFYRKLNHKEIVKKVNQALILSSQIYRYPKHRIKYSNGRLIAEVLA